MCVGPFSNGLINILFLTPYETSKFYIRLIHFTVTSLNCHSTLYYLILVLLSGCGFDNLLNIYMRFILI